MKKFILLASIFLCLISVNSTALAQSEDEVFVVVENSPQFPGGQDALMHFLANNLQYPEMAREAGIQGKVYVQFIVEPDGRITNIKILRDIGGGCGAEAVRVVKKMPKWKPGTQKGKAVRVQYNLPVNFVLTTSPAPKRDKGRDRDRNR